ncbi:thiol reductant ABC exporter subunit CydC [Alkalibaculum sp. M08DMB]|uniref:Thiol reductant ABC exporter subunit CydC n=1 Tax=Alkalibaculum sporogenes TaxID=2655001 RepID=A0A6A7K4T8_9FIRM|nr:thiol reductant ABC exporter subunit CydC [Alkalibaculum sporogenes]MPW24267.1 thiol reductant ABC exporter subunit CydC [Alkalibaculum sporogenes]
MGKSQPPYGKWRIVLSTGIGTGRIAKKGRGFLMEYLKKEIQSHRSFYIVRRLLEMTSPLKGYMILSASAGLLGNFCAVGLMVGGGALICTLAGLNIGFTGLQWGIIMVLCAVFRGVFRYIEHYNGHDVAFRLLGLIREKLFLALQKGAPGNLAENKSGDMISTIMADVELVEVFFAHTISPVIIAGIMSVSMMIFVGQFAINFALILGIFYLLTLGVTYFVNQKIGKDIGNKYRRQFSESTSHWLDSLRGMKEILILTGEDNRLREIRENGVQLNESLGKLKVQRSFAISIPEFLITLATVSIFLLASYYGLSTEKTLIVTVAVASSFGPIVALSNLTVDLKNTFGAARRIFDILDDENFVENSGKREVDIQDMDIRFERVSYQYPSSTGKAINSFSLSMRKGEKMAIMGPSGCGKSTLLRLLLRYFDPQEGNVYLGKYNIREITLESLRKNIALLTQDTFLFDDTIEKNIRIGKPGATMQEIEHSAKRAMVHNFIQTLPHGYQTRVGELGGRLSGGEKQRIGIARVLLTEAPIIVLDEPTSNLDALNEKAILDILKKEFSDRTLIMVSHRSTVLQWADRVYHYKTV